MQKSILITGASTGIGYYTAHELKKSGYQVIASCRSTSDVARLQQEGLECVQIDLADSKSIQRGFVQVMGMTGNHLYGLFNNGAYGQPGAVEDLPINALRQQFETNFFGWCELTNLVLPIMLQQGYGRIIQNSSVLGIAAMPLRGAYNASKYARATHSLSISLVSGRAEIEAEAPLLLTGFKSEIQGVKWVIVNVTHSLGDNGFTTQLNAESMIENSLGFSGATS